MRRITFVVRDREDNTITAMYSPGKNDRYNYQCVRAMVRSNHPYERVEVTALED